MGVKRFAIVRDGLYAGCTIEGDKDKCGWFKKGAPEIFTTISESFANTHKRFLLNHNCDVAEAQVVEYNK